MKFNLDLYKDWLSYMQAELLSWGYSPTDLKAGELPHQFFNAVAKRIMPRKRVLYISDTFSCPIQFRPGWDKIKDDVLDGNDINPHLSKLVDKIDYVDATLSDFGVHHLHLGSNLNGKYIDRTGPLLFALVTDAEFYAVGIYQHGAWVDTDIIEVIHRNWPQAISNHRLIGIGPDSMTDVQRKAVRKKRANAFVTVQDGTVYGMIGGGQTSSGYTITSVIKTDIISTRLKEYSANFHLNEPIIKSVIEDRGQVVLDEVTVNLHVESDKYYAYFPDYGFYIPLQIQA